MPLQLATQPARAAVHTVQAVTRTFDMNRNLGEFRIRTADLEDGVTFTTRAHFVTGGLIGKRAGYDDLNVAIRDLALKTDGLTPAAAIVEREGRFFGRQLKMRDLEQGITSAVTAAWLEEDSMSRVLDVRSTGDRFAGLRAVIDGAYVHRFRR